MLDRPRHLQEDHLLPVTMSESLALGGSVGISWLSTFAAFLSAFGASPASGLFSDGVYCRAELACQPAKHSLVKLADPVKTVTGVQSYGSWNKASKCTASGCYRAGNS
jgi:hypothetical protein